MEPRTKKLIRATGGQPADSAFSMVELLLAITIIATLSMLIVPAAGPVMHGSLITQGGDNVVSALNQARQLALTSNHAVEVRFYKYSDNAAQGGNSATQKFHAIQAFECQDDGTALATGKMLRLPQTVIIDSSLTLSSLLTQNKNWGTDQNGQANAPTKIPTVGSNYQCSAFRFLPDGSTNLASIGTNLPQGGWFFTLHDMKDGDNRTSPPSNFITVKIDPVNGSLKVFRP